ncbi:MAG: hypothetical protein QF689_01240 [Candidatus Latescibacteria bacterium]|jgi:hypothetical protein|nr:hypothetical protein [Gemmatimonadaceae bacterium]MDP6018368.1 hypothetical protein [Candidatus Latescibacterota bacterium]MDP7447185.1 hypothetical protein [Candidatus Latescibacterota bacterium]HJP32854.1 hypothetical protein [Candidatus Latescibacterota bacterium]
MAWWNRDRVRLSGELYRRASAHAAHAGYSSVDEFVEHCVSKEVDRENASDKPTDDEVLRSRLRGLGYVE